MKRSLPEGYVSSLLSYDSNTGIFVWLVSRGSIKPGRTAGTISIGRNRPYLMIKIDKKFYYAHKLAWLLEHGEWAKQLDHINGDGLDNRIENLRKCNLSQNKGNSRTYKNNKSGAKGVFFDKEAGKYKVTIQCKRKRKYIGSFHVFREAKAAYIRTATELFGEFARAV